MILCDREIKLCLNQNRLVIEPEPPANHIDSTAVDLCLGDSLDEWQIPEAESGLGYDDPKFCPARKGFKFADLEKKLTRKIDITASGYLLMRHAFVLGWTRERIYLP